MKLILISKKIVITLSLILCLSAVPAFMMAVNSSQSVIGGNSFDPKDLCKAYDEAFALAGSPNLCTVVQNQWSGLVEGYGKVEISDSKTGRLIARVSYAKEDISKYSFILPKSVTTSGKPIWSTFLEVQEEFQNRGLGSAIVRTYETMLKAVGAQPGDYQLVVASPTRSLAWDKQQAWIDFVARFCAGWEGSIPLSQGIGCYRVIQ